MTVRARRVYEAPDAADGRRVLVDRLWPRGLAKAAAHIDERPEPAEFHDHERKVRAGQAVRVSGAQHMTVTTDLSGRLA
jgi:hypothetical protein